MSAKFKWQMSIECQLHICSISKADGILILYPKNYTQISSLFLRFLPSLLLLPLRNGLLHLSPIKLISTESTMKLSYFSKQISRTVILKKHIWGPSNCLNTAEYHPSKVRKSLPSVILQSGLKN